MEFCVGVGCWGFEVRTRGSPWWCADGLQVPLLILVGVLVLMIPLAIIGATGTGTQVIYYINGTVVRATGSPVVAVSWLSLS